MATRMTAEQRREQVLLAAWDAFAISGLHGTSTQTIATAAGISQPYLFRLFPTKKALFLAVVARCYKRMIDTLGDAVDDQTGQQALEAMGTAYGDLIADRTFLLLQLQIYAACGDEDVERLSRKGFRDTWYTIERLSGVDSETIRQFYSTGMLWNVITAMRLEDVDERWAVSVCTTSGIPSADATSSDQPAAVMAPAAKHSWPPPPDSSELDPAGPVTAPDHDDGPRTTPTRQRWPAPRTTG